MNYREKCSDLAKQVAEIMPVEDLRDFMVSLVYEDAKGDEGMFEWWEEMFEYYQRTKAENE